MPRGVWDRGPIEDRFWARVNKTDTCWLWTGARLPSGYGEIWDGQRMGRAHRYAYELLVGPIPSGLQIDHLCRVRHCVNPDHLEPVTQQENIRRGEAGLTSGQQQSAKTSCPAGHPYDAENTYRYKRQRHCRACRRVRDRAAYANAKQTVGGITT